MKIGVSLPQTDIGTDPSTLRDFAQTVEELGFDHLVIYDHVLGANRGAHDGEMLYSQRDMFHEPLVTLGYLAGHTRRIGFATAILILPQRQTALVAKQAAEVDILSRGRLRLGVGVGWNPVEFQALGMDFHNRGLRIVEQLLVLRALWTQECVTYRGRWHTIVEAGINPLPVQRPIPIWMGGDANVVLRRIARFADGWFPRTGTPSDLHLERLERLRQYIQEAGRNPQAVGIEPHINLGMTSQDEWRGAVDAWREAGATHLFVSTMGAGFTRLDSHLQVLHRFRDALSGSF